MNGNMIEINNITYSYGKNDIFHNASSVFNSNEISFLVGPNGSGKTTLTKLILGILKLKEHNGVILVDGTNVNDIKLSEMGRKIGYLFQNPDKQLFNPTVKDELIFYEKYYHIPDKKYNEELINLLELSMIMDHKVINLSEGEKKRLALACILQRKPKYLILDEPSSGLDENNQSKLIKILKNIKETNLIGSLIISHNKRFIDKLSDNIYTIKDGKIVYEN